MKGFEGICPECGGHYCGLGLNDPHNWFCARCGNNLEIRKDQVLVNSGFSPFKYEEIILGLDKDKGKVVRGKNVLFYSTNN